MIESPQEQEDTRVPEFLRDSPRRYELIPFIVAIIVLFVGGLVSIRHFYDQRVKDNRAHIEQICTNAENGRRALHDLFLGGMEDQGRGPDEIAAARRLLDERLPIVQPCGDDQTPDEPTTVESLMRDTSP